jgi:hypothetical protein
VFRFFLNLAFFSVKEVLRIRFILVLICSFFGSSVIAFLNAQTFSATISSPVSLANSNGTCASPGIEGTNHFVIPVSSVSTLSTTNAVCGVTMKFSGNGISSYRMRDLDIILKSPGGTCVTIYKGGGVSGNNGGLEFLDLLPLPPNGNNAERAESRAFVMRLVTKTPCLNYPNQYTGSFGVASTNNQVGNDFTTDGASMIFGTPNDMTSGFTGSANGNWQLIFTGPASSAPHLVSASITFGNPTYSDRTSDGDNCSTAIDFTGSPICAQTTSKTASSNMPGNTGTSTGFSTSWGCTGWNAANNNDVWIKFIAQTTNVCINISGLDGNLQSIVVTDPNSDNDGNACTGAANGIYWTVVNCPRNAIYSGSTGNRLAQNHCFTANIGQTYYLVVDGDGGTASSYYISGISGTTYNALPIQLVTFQAKLENKSTLLTWQTASERNNDYFTVERSANGTEWEVLESVKGAGFSNELLSYQTYDPYPLKGISYYRLKQTDYDGKYAYSKTEAISNTEGIMVLPNPGSGMFYISGLSDRQERVIVVRDITGKEITKMTAQKEMQQLDLSQQPSGVYFVTINAEETIRVIKVTE